MIKKFICLLLIGIIGFLQLHAQSININDDIQFIQVQDSVFMHVTWENSERFGRFSSNGMIIIKNGEAIMVDTPMDNEKTQLITEYLKDSMQVEVTDLIIGHFHSDCLGGLEYIQEMGIESIANARTVEKCKELGLPIPPISFTDSFIMNFNGEQIICNYFGAGHSVDNITVWIPSKKILFGGCLVKSYNSRGLGNLSDAVVSDWDSTIETLMNTYTDIKTVVPGHGNYGGVELLTHTIHLVKIEKQIISDK